MMAATQLHPIDILQALETRGKQAARKLPQQGEQKSLWRGVAFRVAGLNLVTPITQVEEIMRYPKLTPVPNTLPWIKGLANIRGKLMAIIDLAAFLGQPGIINPSSSSILLIQQDALLVGIMVNEILGLKHFDPTERIAADKITETLEPGIATKVRGVFKQNGRLWHLFDMRLLATDAKFTQAAV